MKRARAKQPKAAVNVPATDWTMRLMPQELIATQAGALGAALTLLLQIEWCGGFSEDNGLYRCPSCEHFQPCGQMPDPYGGHDDGCALVCTCWTLLYHLDLVDTHNTEK